MRPPNRFPVPPRRTDDLVFQDANETPSLDSSGDLTLAFEKLRIENIKLTQKITELETKIDMLRSENGYYD